MENSSNTISLNRLTIKQQRLFKIIKCLDSVWGGDRKKTIMKYIKKDPLLFLEELTNVDTEFQNKSYPDMSKINLLEYIISFYGVTDEWSMGRKHQWTEYRIKEK